MTEGIWIAIIGCAQALMLAMLAKTSRDTRRTKQAAEQANEQVTNSHTLPSGETYNLRDNIDHNQAAVMAEFRGMRRDLGRLESRVFRTEEKIDRIDEKQDAHLQWSLTWSPEQERVRDELKKRVTDIEDTLNPKEKP